MTKKKNTCNWDTYNSDHHIPYFDDEIDLILSFSPSKENCEVLARNLKRSLYAIDMIFRIASTPLIDIKNHYRSDDPFLRQVKKIARKKRWITGLNITKYPSKKVAKK